MKKIFSVLLIAVTLLGVSGCFPVFVPVHDHHYGHHHRDWGYR